MPQIATVGIGMFLKSQGIYSAPGWSQKNPWSLVVFFPGDEKIRDLLLIFCVGGHEAIAFEFGSRDVNSPSPKRSQTRRIARLVMFYRLGSHGMKLIQKITGQLHFPGEMIQFFWEA